MFGTLLTQRRFTAADFALPNPAMTVERVVRIIAGTFVLASLALGIWVNHNWFWFTAFVGANLFQSGFTNWCLAEIILKKLGVGATPQQPAPRRA